MTQPQRVAPALALAARVLLARRHKAAAVNPAARRRLTQRLPAAQSLYHRAAAATVRHKSLLGDLPPLLRWLIQSLIAILGDLFGRLDGGELTAEQWVDRVETQLADYHLAAYMAGARSDQVPPKALDKVARQVAVQVNYLNGFKAEIQSAAQFQAGWKTRAESYASAIKQPYWTGRTRLLPLPAMPAQGTQCQNNCGCSWDITWIDEEKLSADARWVRGKKDSCQTCLERAAQWNPVKIRDGVLL